MWKLSNFIDMSKVEPAEESLKTLIETILDVKISFSEP